MRIFTPVTALIAVGASASLASASEAPEWPERGVLKLASDRMPGSFKLDVPGCFSVELDAAKNSIVATSHAADSPVALAQPGSALLEGGGAFVGLIMREGGQFHVVANTQTPDGGYDVQTIRLPATSCRLTKAVISSPEPAKLSALRLSVSQEIERLLKKNVASA